MDRGDYRNSEGYEDPTAYEAMKKIERERFNKVLNKIFDVCKEEGFEISNRITLIDKKTGRVWK